MRITHELPAGWVDTGEAGRIQPSHVAGLVHVVTLEPGDLVEGPQGPAGEAGPQGPAGPQGARGVAPAGAVLFFAMAAAPAGWLVCDGSMVSRAAYVALFAAIGTLYGAGDGATTFELPDLRGEFLRGADGGRGVDVGRGVGSGQGDELRSHGHGGGAYTSEYYMPYGDYYSVAVSGNTQFFGGDETRPRNVAMLPCISTGA